MRLLFSEKMGEKVMLFKAMSLLMLFTLLVVAMVCAPVEIFAADTDATTINSAAFRQDDPKYSTEEARLNGDVTDLEAKPVVKSACPPGTVCEKHTDPKYGYETEKTIWPTADAPEVPSNKKPVKK